MGNLIVGKICQSCHIMMDSAALKCGKCGGNLSDCVAKILTVDNRPFPENPEPAGRLIRYWTLEEIRAKIEYALEKGIGRVRCTCGHDLKTNQMMHYPHRDGVPIVGIGPQWIYLHCRTCHYDWALWKLSYGIEGVDVPAKL